MAMVCLIGSLGAGRAVAQSVSGKIEGTVRDSGGAPIAGAQVSIVGSAYRSPSNDQGYYFLNNVPAGVVTVRAQFIGYAPSETRNVRVFADQTVTVDFRLEMRPLEVEAITVVVEGSPQVPRDEVASKAITSGDLVRELPVRQVSEILRLEPGVVESGRGLSIRGGRIGEAAVYLDGVPVRSIAGTTGVNAMTSTVFGLPSMGTNVIGTNAVEELTVTTGAIGATQGDAQSGVIAFVTRSGGQRLSGSLSGLTDEVGGQRYGQGLNRLEASLGGPLAGRLTFFVATVMEGRQSPADGIGSQATPFYVLDGVDTTVTVASSPGSVPSDSVRIALPQFTRYSAGMRLPDNWSSDWNLDGKLSFTYGTGSRISATFHRTRGQGLNSRLNIQNAGFSSTIYDSQAQRGYLNQSNALVLNWVQTINHAAGHALALEVDFSLQGNAATNGAVDPGWFARNQSPTADFAFGDMQFVVNRDNFALDDRLLQNIRVNNCANGRDAARHDMGGCIPFLNREQEFAAGAEYRTNPYGVTAGGSYFPAFGIGNPLINLSSETRVVGHVNVDWQANRFNRIQAGGDVTRADSWNYIARLTDQSQTDVSRYQPLHYAAYATNRLDLGDMVMDFGLRYESINPGVLYPQHPGRLFSDPLRSGTSGLAKVLPFVTTAADSAQATATANACQADLAAADTASWSTCNMAPGTTHGALLPSLRVSFPVTDRTAFRLSYAHQAQAPDISLYSSGVNSDINTVGGSVFGSDLSMGRTILYEFGVRHAFSQDLILDVSAYNKDKSSDVAARHIVGFDYFDGRTETVNQFTNQDFGNVRGLDIKIDRRVGSLFQATLAYSLEAARSTGSDPTEYVNAYSHQFNTITGDVTPPPQATLVTADNRTHTIAGSLALNFPQGWHAHTRLGSILQGSGVFATFRFASGLPYTRELNDGVGDVGPRNYLFIGGVPVEPLNASSTPWFRNVDLRVLRSFEMKRGRHVTVFAEFRNLFNFTNIVSLFTETGDVVNEKFLESQINPIMTVLRGEADTLYTSRSIGGVMQMGVDLHDCSAFEPAVPAGIPDCIMLRRAEARFADPDDPGGRNFFFTDSEQTRAFTAWYMLQFGPQTLRGPGLRIHLGFELGF